MVEYILPSSLNQTGGPEFLLTYIGLNVGSFIFMMFLFFFCVMVGAGYFSSYRRSGKGKLLMWLSISSLITTTAAIVLFLSGAYLSLEEVVLMVSLTLLFGFFFIMSNVGD